VVPQITGCSAAMSPKGQCTAKASDEVIGRVIEYAQHLV
jgi:hypothetical protein